MNEYVWNIGNGNDWPKPKYSKKIQLPLAGKPAGVVVQGCAPASPSKFDITYFSTIDFFSTGATTHCGFVFCSPLAGL